MCRGFKSPLLEARQVSPGQASTPVYLMGPLERILAVLGGMHGGVKVLALTPSAGRSICCLSGECVPWRV